MDSEVTQTPEYLIKSRKQQVILRWSPDSGHRSVYWYQQALGQGLQFLIQYYNRAEYEKGNISDQFSGKQFSDSSSELNLTSLELTDSAVYLCASSQEREKEPLFAATTESPAMKTGHSQIKTKQSHPCSCCYLVAKSYLTLLRPHGL